MVAQFRFITETLAAPEYNCGAHTPDEWSRIYGEPQYALGVWSIFAGCLPWVMYLPALRYFFRENRFTCIKIMRALALVDMTGMLCDGVFFGIQMVQGVVFCSNPAFGLLTGLGAYVCWNVSSCLCVFLVVNRILEIIGKEHYFQGSRRMVVMLAAAVYGFTIVLFIPPVLPNSRHQAMHFCPFIPGFEYSFYVNYTHVAHNSTMCILITSLFILLCATVKFNSYSPSNVSPNLKKMQSKIFTQALIICIVEVGGSFLYLLLNFIPTPQFVSPLVMIGCHLIYATPSIVYLSMSQHIQQELKNMLGVKPDVVELNPAFTASSATRDALQPSSANS